MTAAERLLLLLCSDLGQAEARPLRPAQYALLRERLLAAASPDAELDAKLLRQLGYDEIGAAQILALLERDPQPWLRQVEQWGMGPLTRLDPRYPQRLREKLRETAPLLLYANPSMELLNRPAVSVVGSRKLHETGRSLAEAAGRWIAEHGYVLCTGGAAGADTVALEACLAAGGSAILCLPGDVRETLKRYLPYVRQRGRLQILSAAPMTRFHPARALERNRWIHALGQAVIVCQCEAGSGGSWRGAAENLRNHWSPVFVSSDDSDGSRDLCTRGAEPLDWNALQNVLP